MNALPQGPFTLLIAALGGEGGGVLADWVVEAATDEGYPVQSTSIPGVSQRTGATTYYVEIYPMSRGELAGREPVLALVPSPGAIDMVAASELIEAGRAMQCGFVSPERTTMIAADHRIYAVAEKSTAADNRYASPDIVSAARALARKSIIADFGRAARESGTVINAVLFGAMAGSGVFPVSRASCESAIRRSGKAAEASLRGFSAGYALAQGGAASTARAPAQHAVPKPMPRVHKEFPESLHEVLDLAVERLSDYQDQAYAALFLDRVRQVLAVDREAGGEQDGYRMTRETARLLALWMSYEDVIRVAELKTRSQRLSRVRQEVGAKPDQPVMIADYLRPGVDEVCALLPAAWAAAGLRNWAVRRGGLKLPGLRLKTSTLHGYLALRMLARLKPLRRRGSRFAEEQALIERWLGALKRLGFACLDRELALEIALCAAMVRGYGETHGKGRQAFVRVLDEMVENEAAVAKGVEPLKLAIRQAREEVLGGRKAPAAPARTATVKPLVFMKRPK